MNICIVAYKDLTLNTRITRQTHSLVSNGHTVTLLALGEPVWEAETDKTKIDFRKIDLSDRAASSAFILLFRLDKAQHRINTKLHSLLGATAIVNALFSTLIWIVSWFVHWQGDTPYQKFSALASHRVKGQEFDLVQVHDDPALLAGANIAGRCGARLIFDAVELPHEYSYLPSPGPWRQMRLREMPREREVIRSVSEIITVSNNLAQHIGETWKREPATVVRNCRLYEEKSQERGVKERLGLSEADDLVLYLNSVWKGQGLEQLIDALALLPSRVHVAIMGPEAQRGLMEELRVRAEKSDVSNRFHYLEMVPSNEVVRNAAGADIGVIPRQNDHPNLFYSLPNRVFEMIMAQLPIACCRLPEIAGIVQEHGNGVVFDETDPADIASKIETLTGRISDEEFRRNLANAAKTLCWEKEVLNYLTLIEAKNDP